MVLCSFCMFLLRVFCGELGFRGSGLGCFGSLWGAGGGGEG